MEEAYIIVIKVKYGDVLRRFSSWISDSELGVNVDELKEKILSLFKLPQNSALTLTYIDEDDDEVMLVDDDDLRDIVRQRLDLLRITVKLTAEKNATKYYSSGSSTPLKSPPVQKPFQCTKTALEPLCETLVKLSTNLASKVSTSTPDIKSLVNYFSEVSSSYLAYISEFQPRMQTPTDNFVMKDSETSKADAAQSMVRSNVGFEGFIKQNESMEKLELLATVIDNSVKLGDKSVVSIKTSSATGPGLNDVGLDSKTINAGQVPLQNLGWLVRKKNSSRSVNVFEG
ncbi:protein JOKA2-like isoform X1 [Primulina tabacum]|uniref:protein JOKA2-like isoform X1 n=1 Tax=Primulina tabacum TaxID=48773 RepID=UPI003F5980FE